jgi:hypothetical protein
MASLRLAEELQQADLAATADAEAAALALAQELAEEEASTGRVPSAEAEASLRLAEELLVADESERAARHSMELASIQLAEEMQQADTEASRHFDCKVCCDTQPIDGSFTGDCGHRTCRSCMRSYILSKLADEQVVEEQLCCVHGCGCKLTVPEVVGTLKAFGLRDAADQFVALRTSLAIQADGTYGCCPRCKTSHFKSASEAAGPGFCAECSHCRHRFCSRCNAPRCHFLDGLPVGADCDAFMRSKHAAWLQWQASGQAAYLTELSKVDAEYSQRLKAFEVDTAARRATLDAFQRDENAKQGWVHCPHCNTAWAGRCGLVALHSPSVFDEPGCFVCAGSDACSHVTCGVLESSMGQQRAVGIGCGRAFDLNSARKYNPTLIPPISVAEAMPVAPVRVEHHVSCDRCHAEPIRGVRLRCLQCPHFNLCLPCLAEHGPDHAAEEEWPGRGESPHVFDVVHEPLQEQGTAEQAPSMFSLPVAAAYRLARYVVGGSG